MLQSNNNRICSQLKLTAYSLLLSVLCCLTLISASLAEPHVFDAFYYVTGTVETSKVSGGIVADGRKVLFYSLEDNGPYPDNLETTVESGGTKKFLLNAYDNINVPISEGKTYYVAIERGSDGYGADPVAMSLSSEGYSFVTLTLEKDKGPVPYIVPLYITRNGDTVNSDIKLSWTVDTTNPTLYVLYGDGSGTYTNDITKWATVEYDGISFVKGEKYILHKNQVRTGSPEAYYKALYPGIDKSYLTTEKAVGKINLTIEASTTKNKLNLISLPLVPQD